MKKKALFSAIIAGILLSSCIKDGDFEELKSSDFGISLGESISFGFPLGYAEFTIGELLGKWQNTDAIVWEGSNETMTISYDSSYAMVTTFGGYMTNKPGKNQAKAHKSTIEPLDTVFRYEMDGSVDIDLFKNMDEIVNNLTVEGINARLNVNLRAIMNNYTSNLTVVEFLRQFIDAPYIDSLTISSTGYDDNVQELPIEGSTTFTLDQLASPEGSTLELTNAEGAIDDLVNSRPKKMMYHLVVKVPIHISADQIAAIGEDEFPDNIEGVLSDVVKINALMTNAQITAHFPLRMKCTDLVYSDTTMRDGTINIYDLQKTLDQIDDATGNTSFRIAIKYTNTLPLSFSVSDYLLDEDLDPAMVKINGKNDTVHFFAQNFVISAPTLQRDGDLYYSSTENPKTMLLDITKEQVEAMKSFGGMVIKFTLNSAEDANHTQPSVSIRKDDKLTLQAFLLVNDDDPESTIQKLNKK
ncbi:MAG: hypothetical protein IJ844_09260 [Prevotella sp.]|nr:hypothetical protein [Prevotella sp.]